MLIISAETIGEFITSKEKNPYLNMIISALLENVSFIFISVKRIFVNIIQLLDMITYHYQQKIFYEG
jgi:hypothetical protein